MALGTRLLLLLLLLLLFCYPLSNCVSFPTIPNATGDVLLGAWCPQSVDDCHLWGSCYSSFKVCAQLNDMAKRCISVPGLEKGYHCQSQTQRPLTNLSISINSSIVRLSVEVQAQKKSIISKLEPTTHRIKLLPGLVALSNAGVPKKNSWQSLTLPLLFDFKAALRCRQNRYGPLCHTLCGASGCSTTPSPIFPTTTTTPAHRKKCLYNYCLNGGSCELDASGRERCVCKHNFFGTRCESQDWCRSKTFCLNGGTCMFKPSSSMAICQCTTGWVGTRCEAKDPCSPNPCQNSATCSGYAGKAACKCPAAWIGTLCELANPCTKQPCKNGGNCSVEGISFKCSCPDNTFGNACQLMFRQSLLDNQIFVIMVSVGISLLIVITLFFGVCLLCRRTKRVEKQRTERLEAALRAQHRERHPSDIYAEIDSENCYSDGSESDNNFETGVKGQRTRTRTRSQSALFSSRATSCISRDGDKTV